MRIGIRTKLVLAFILVIILPVGVIFGAVTIFQGVMEKDPQLQEISQLNPVLEGIVDLAQENFSLVQDYDAFDRKLTPQLKENNAALRVIDNNGVLLYDSQDKDASMARKVVEIPQDDYNIYSYQENNNGKFRFTDQIIVGNQVVGHAVVYIDLQKTNEALLRRVIFYGIGIAGAGLLAWIGFVALFSWLISRSVLVPLRELNTAAESIAEGNLDFQIEYRGKDELGRFCQAFDTMRVKLKKSLEEQTAYENSRKELIASISHDLRTPIASIKGYVEGLQDGIVKDEEQFNRYLAVIRDKSEKLDRLIDDLFQFSRLELGRLEVDMQPWDSRALLEGIFEPLEMDFHQQPLEFVVKRPFPSVKIQGDEKRLTQVVDNLLQNAKRYVGEKGKIIVQAEEEGDCLKVSIQDNGTGIPPEDLPHIFERFYRGEKSRSRDYGGTGLGLAICRQIVEAHGGRIWVESRLGEGTVFHFTIPKES